MKRFVLVVLLLALSGLGVWYWSRRHGADEATDEGKPAAKVEFAPLKRQMIAQTLDAFGVVASAPSGEQVAAAPFDCIVRKIFVSTGATVAAGDPLLEIDPSPEAKLQLDSARGAFALAGKALAATQERYDLKLANSQDLLTAQQGEQDARLKVTSLEARGLGGDGKIAAGAPGVVGKFELTVGTLVPAGTALVSVSTARGLEARLGVEVGELAAIHPGQVVVLQSANRATASSVASSVRLVGGAVEATTGAVEVRVPVPLGAQLLVGEHVKAAIVLRQREGLVVARSAVLPDGEKQVLFTVKDGKAVRHEVNVGIVAGDAVEVSGENLREGDSVVTLGNYELSDGMAVQSVETDGKEAGQPARPEQGTKP